MKKYIQKLIRNFHVLMSKNQLPSKISIYFHETQIEEIDAIEEIIKYFNKLNYEFVTIENFNNHEDNTKRQFAFTFDDGFTSWVELIDIFEKYNVSATFFLNTIQFTSEEKNKFLYDIKVKSEEKLITVNELKRLVEFGHEIGSHTHSHITMKNTNEENFKKEIKKNLDILKDLKIFPTNFAVPFGMRRHTKKYQIDYLLTIFSKVCLGEAGMLYNHTKNVVHRYPWIVDKSLEFNLENIKTNTSYFNNITKRSGLG